MFKLRKTNEQEEGPNVQVKEDHEKEEEEMFKLRKTTRRGRSRCSS